MAEPTSIVAVSSVIELALAPAFLFTGIAGFLAMLSVRLGRVIDRGRLLDRQIPALPAGPGREALVAEAGVVWRRIRWLNGSFRFAVVSALLICIVVVCLFAGDYFRVPLGGTIAALFVGAMVFLILALVTLLVEVAASTSTMRQDLEHLVANPTAEVRR